MGSCRQLSAVARVPLRKGGCLPWRSQAVTSRWASGLWSIPPHTHTSGVKGRAQCYRNGCSVLQSLGFSTFQMGVFKTHVLGPARFGEEPGARLYVPASHSLPARPGASSATLECSIILALSRSQAESRGCMDICGSLGFLWVWRITGLSVPFFFRINLGLQKDQRRLCSFDTYSGRKKIRGKSDICIVGRNQ